MALLSGIRSALSGIAAKFAEGTVEYRRLTSAPNATPRTYSSWVVIPDARVHNLLNEQEQDLNTGMWFMTKTCELRVPFHSNVLLDVRCQVRTTPPSGIDTAAQVWNVVKETSNASGSVSSYDLKHRDPMLTDARKGGGV